MKTVFLFFLLFVSLFVNAQSRDSFASAFDNHSAIMLLIEPASGNIIYANQAAKRFYGFASDELTTMKIQQINMLTAAQVAEERELAAAQNRNYFIFRHQLADGVVKTVQVHSSPIELDQQMFLFSVIRDISSEREAQQELWHYQSNLEAMVDEQVKRIDQQSQQKLTLMLFGMTSLGLFSVFMVYVLRRKIKAEQQIKTLSQIVEQSPIAIATLDSQGCVSYSNKQFDEVQKVRMSTLNLKSHSLIASYIQDNQEQAAQLQQISQTSVWHGELHSKGKNNKDFWEYSHVYPLASESDHAKQVMISQNITQLKENERDLRLASTVFHTATEAVMICDTNNCILAINEAFTKITGYTEDEAIGKTPALLKSGHHGPEFYNEMYIALEQTGQWQGEISNRRKNGELYYEWLSITALKNPTGQLEAFVSLFSDITKRKMAEDKIYQQANFDTLTGLANRTLFSDRLTQCINVAERESHKVALLFLDLDGFKQVNDNLGHSLGDVLLQQVAKRLSGVLRKSDVVSRLGGDEFAVVIPATEDIFSIERIALKIVEKIAQPYDLNGSKGYVTASIGIAMYPDDGLSL